jgi:hypothetical protein
MKYDLPRRTQSGKLKHPFLLRGLCVLCGILVCFLSGCAHDTIRPEAPKAQTASFDSTVQDSGIVSAEADGFLVTAHFRDRYNAMVELYGHEPEFIPPLERDRGIVPSHKPGRGEYLCNGEAMARFVQLNRWRKMGRKPTPVVAEKPSIVVRVMDAVMK